MAYRIDTAGSLRPVRRMADGRIRVDAHLTRTGVFSYRNADGSVRREYRPDSEVFHPDALASFEALPVTDDHPPEMLTAATAMQFTRGASGESVRRDGDHVAASIVVFDAKLVGKMERGKLQVSNGYSCDLDETPGVSPQGEKYDAVQRNIRGNHVAIVDHGRAGSARVRMDGADVPTSDPVTDAEHTVTVRVVVENAGGAGPNSGERRTDGASPMDLEAALKALGAEKARADQAEKDAATAKAAAAKAEGERDAEKARADAAATDRDAKVAAAEKSRKDDADRFDASVEARADLVAKAHAVLGPDEAGKRRDFKGQTDRAIQCAVVQKVDGFDCADAAKYAPEYVQARYDSAIARVGGGIAANDAARAALGVPRADAVTDGAAAEKAAQDKMNAAARDAHKEGK